jgi:dienelactone hydrolase
VAPAPVIHDEAGTQLDMESLNKKLNEQATCLCSCLLMKNVTAFLLSILCTQLCAEQIGPWDLDALKSKVPKLKWIDQTTPIHSLTYEGEKYQGYDTEIFAFYASPITLGVAKPGSKFSGVVCIHGGGGTAFAEWVQLWAKRGYAAIAMDLNGSRPPEPIFDTQGLATGNGHRGVRVRLAKGGPPHGSEEKFNNIGGDSSDDWPFHAAASVMRAHTLLRSFPEVEADHTAVTGISWGGYTTCLVASLDDRFKAAVPVYGCGFLHEGESVQKPSIDKLGDRKAAWVKAYDPGSLLPRCHVPIFFVNGTNDIHYVLDSYMKSYAVVPGEKQMRIQVNMPHGHQPGWAPNEIVLFIDSKCRGGKALPVPGEPVIKGDQVEVICKTVTALQSAAMNYTTDSGPRSKRKWITTPATISGDIVTASKPPAEANTWFISITDERGAMVTTLVKILP